MCDEYITAYDFFLQEWYEAAKDTDCSKQVAKLNNAINYIMSRLTQLDFYTIQEEIKNTTDKSWATSFTTKYWIDRVVEFYWKWNPWCTDCFIATKKCSACKWSCGCDNSSYWKIRMSYQKPWFWISKWEYTFCKWSNNIQFEIPKWISWAYLSYVPRPKKIESTDDLIYIPNDLLYILSVAYRFYNDTNKWEVTTVTQYLDSWIKAELEQIKANTNKYLDNYVDMQL